MLLIASASAYVICIAPQIAASLPAADLTEVPAGVQPGFVISNLCSAQDVSMTISFTPQEGGEIQETEATIPVVGTQTTELTWLDSDPLQPGQYTFLSDSVSLSFTVTDTALETVEGAPQASFVEIDRQKNDLTVKLDMQLLDIEPGLSLLSFEDAEGNEVAAAAAEDVVVLEIPKTSSDLCLVPVQWDASQTPHRGELICEKVPACATVSPAGLVPLLMGGLLVVSRRSRL